MRIAIVGRSEVLYDTALALLRDGHEIGLIITAKAAPEYTRTAEDFARLAQQIGCPYHRTVRIGEACDLVRSLAPIELCISFNYPGIVPQEFIDLFPLGMLNGHAGDLPRYRGNAPIAWALLVGERRVAMCVHRMIGGVLDAGDIVVRRYHDVDIDTKVGTVLEWVQYNTADMFVEAARILTTDPTFVLERQSIDPSDALRCYPRMPEDGRIDWREDRDTILRLINASGPPYAGAFCDLNGERLIIWQAERCDDGEQFLAVPGQITDIGPGYVEVACGNGKLRCTEIGWRNDTCSPDTVITSRRARLG